jgi:acetylornithine deacetylase/succinyl-diaminopimelate desuccinylase-like protein
MVEVIQCLRQISVPVHPVLGPATLVLTDMISHPYPGTSVVPDGCRITCDWRSTVGETPESVLDIIEKSIQGLYEQIPQFQANVSLATNQDHCYTGLEISGNGFYPAWLLPEDHELVVKAVQGLSAVGMTPEISHYSFCTNGSFYAGIAGVPTIGFGPSREDQAHVLDEYIEINQLLQATIGYQAISGALLR